jgi:hypothetical protein
VLYLSIAYGLRALIDAGIARMQALQDALIAYVCWRRQLFQLSTSLLHAFIRIMTHIGYIISRKELNGIQPAW